jgi:uncharacterized protein involved in exopolysaccharide biosynthesis
MGKEKKYGQHYDFSSTDLLLFAWEKRNPLILITGLAAVLSMTASFTITPLFKSSVIMFPATNASVSKNLISDNYSGRESIYEIGTEEQSEQLLQVLNSEEIRNRIIKKFDLMKHYKIDPGSRYPLTKLYARYKKNINFKRTEYMSVVIEVLDKDPQIAADIANDISSLTDTVFNKMLKKRAYDAFLLVQKEYDEMLRNLKLIRDSLDLIQNIGVNNYLLQADRYYEAYGKALLDGNTKALQDLDQKLKIISKYGGAYISLGYQQEYETERLSRIKQRYAEAKLEVEQTLPHKFIVDSAYKAEKKAYPKKSIIVIVSTISAFLMGLITLIILDNLKHKTKV